LRLITVVGMGFPSVVRLPSGVYLTGPSYGSSSGRLAGRPSPEDRPVRHHEADPQRRG
jgi:hypothetical protein